MVKKKKYKGSPQHAYRLSHPWIRLLEWARRRCNDHRSRWFKYYGAKGIKCDLNGKELGLLWIRDNAAALARPSLDRIDANKNYTLSNCRIIEFNLNVRMGWDPTARPQADEPAAEAVPF